MPEQNDLLERGLQLACFIFPDRPTAILILTGAVNKLRVQQEREARRTYWRDKHLKRGITRITRDENDTLQWLIFFESDAYEKQQEDRGGQTLKDMVVRYIKTLVRAGTAMSSFYVSIGLHRLLHSYTTAEVQRLYEVVTDRYPGADEFRRAKSMLMGRLLDRFGDMLTTSRVQHGELRFVTEDDSMRWSGLVDACLKAFTPWSTAQACPLPRDFDANSGQLPPRLSGDGQMNIDSNLVEINRCHVFIDPVCCGRLAQALAFEPPQNKLAVPRFHMENNKQDHSPKQEHSPLTSEERTSIHHLLSQQASRRESARPDSVRIVVDGAQRVQMPLNSRTERAFVIQEGAELIELWCRDAGGEDLLLGIHPVAYTQSQGIAEQRIVLYRNRGRRLLLTVLPEPPSPSNDQPGRAIVTLHSQPGLAASWLSGGAAWRWGLAAGSLATAVLLLSIGWLLGNKARTAKLASVPPASTTITTTPKTAVQPPPPPVETARSYRLIPDELITRGAGGASLPVIAMHEAPALIILELPVGQHNAHKSFRVTLKRFSGPSSLLMEDSLKAEHTASGWTVNFPVPARLLQAGHDYTVHLDSRGLGATLGEVGSYTFHAR